MQQVTTNILDPCSLNVLHRNKKILGTLDMFGHFHLKRQCQLVETLLLICMQKMNSNPNLFFEML